jgi:hypothetical protein
VILTRIQSEVPDETFNELLKPVYKGKGLTDKIDTARVSYKAMHFMFGY